jgi:outer membrane receptor protein involved in Fe transport
LKPEIIDTFELASDWTVARNLSWKINIFHTRFKNLIAYASSNNASANLYTLTTRGLETELYFGLGAFKSFLNASYAKRVDEEILLPEGITPVTGETTWAPTITANLGGSYHRGPWTAGVTLHYQGEVKRRPSDYDPGVDSFRPHQVGSWLGADLRIAYKVTKGVEVELSAKNAADTEGRMVKNFAYPFDYRTEPRRITFGIRIN